MHCVAFHLPLLHFMESFLVIQVVAHFSLLLFLLPVEQAISSLCLSIHQLMATGLFPAWAAPDVLLVWLYVSPLFDEQGETFALLICELFEGMTVSLSPSPDSRHHKALCEGSRTELAFSHNFL